jgi:hypothetical protein
MAATDRGGPTLEGRVRRRMARKCPVCSNDAWYLKQGLARLAEPPEGGRLAAAAIALCAILAAAIALAPAVRALFAG